MHDRLPKKMVIFTKKLQIKGVNTIIHDFSRPELIIIIIIIITRADMHNNKLQRMIRA